MRVGFAQRIFQRAGHGDFRLMKTEEAPARLALIGMGKMGRMIESLAPDHDFTVVLRLDSQNNVDGQGITASALENVAVAIEFTAPAIAVQNLKALARLRIPTVTGTTGWFDQIADIRHAVTTGDTGLVYSPNFSVGVAVFRKVVARAAELLKDDDAYGAWAWEIHHSAKKDSPSGTLLQLLQSMRDEGYERNIDVAANRAGSIPGTHEVGFDSLADTITLRHTARSRNGFAVGALKAARWIMDRKGIYTFDEMLFGQSER